MMLAVPTVNPTVLALTALVCVVAYAAIYWDLRSQLTPAGKRVALGVFLLALVAPPAVYAAQVPDYCQFLTPGTWEWIWFGCWL
jgi:hypothetical protein